MIKVDFKTKRGKQLLIITAVSVIFIILFSIPFILHRLEHEHDHDHGPGDEIYQDTLGYNNRQVITSFFGASVSDSILTCLESNLLTEQEKSTAPHKNNSNGMGDNYYELTFNENSISQLSTNDSLYATDFYYTYKLNTNISDGRKYEITTKVMSERYKPDFSYTILKNMQSNNYILCKNNIEDQSALLKWATEELKINTDKIINK